jgi:ATP/maltotriose-dependent transcriptional regulator MalT/DNA-binding SARP family transcriptional activator
VATVATGLIARPRLARTLVDGIEAGSVVLVAGPGYGKTLALEEALQLAGRRSLWISCGDSGGEAARLLLGVVEGLRNTVPGLADVVGDRLAAGVEPVDVRSASAALLPELERLLVEPLVIVFDDAEELEGADGSLAFVDQLLALRAGPLSVAIATRRALGLKLAKLRAAGRLVEIGPAGLSFTVSECAELLTLRSGREPTEDEVEAVVAASEGWPMGVALTSLAGTRDAAIEAIPREELFHYLAEEVLDRLDPAMRLGVVASSVPDTLTPELARDLGLPRGFIGEAERAGLFLRSHAGVRSYHPLFRAFLRERLRELYGEDEREALHARAAESLGASGRSAESIEHWLEAGRYEDALSAVVMHSAELVRTSPGAVTSWLSRLPAELAGEPDYLLLEGQLQWAAGRQDLAVEPFRAAVSGYSAAGNVDREWNARMLLADCLILTGAFADVVPLAEGWDEVTSPAAANAAVVVAWYQVVALSTVGQLEEADELRDVLRHRAGSSPFFSFLDALGRAQTEFSSCRTEAALEVLHAVIGELDLDDPHGRKPYAMGMVLTILRNLGEREAALDWLDRCERESESVGMGFAVRDFRVQRASLLAQAGDLSRAEAQLASAGTRPGTGWRAVYEASAEALVANLRGDSAAAANAAARALESGAVGPMPWRLLATTEMSAVLAEAGALDAARYAIDTALAALERSFPGERGRLHRAWLGASRACIEYTAGESSAARGSMQAAWEEAGGIAGRMLRAHWPAIRPVFWHALAGGAVSAEDALFAMQDAFPGSDALVAMVEHPDAAVRRTALLTALSAGHPSVLAQLAELEHDGDEQVAAAAAATRERVGTDPPPLRFELLGGFRVRRAGWELGESAWQRPMAARVVRFLLIQGSTGVPEDVLFDAFWPDRDADSARQHLAQAVSRARKVLDLLGAEQSVIEAKERTYRLRLRERDSVDFDQFETAAAAALADRGRDRRAGLEAAAALWTGEPLPEDLYAPWSFAWRERLVQTYSHVLSALVETYEASGDHHDAIRAATRLLELDPLNERAHGKLMVAYARTGRKSQALRQFLECRRALVSDLGVEPSAETARLQARILAGEPV